MYGVWALLAPVPPECFYFLITFDNSGGILNLGVYIIIRRKNLTQGEKASASGDKELKTSVTKISEIRKGYREQASFHSNDTPMA